jgi:hypothetical protein
MTWLGEKAKAVASAIGSLSSIADRTANVLKKVWNAAQAGAGLRTAVLFGSLGFFVGAPAAVALCVYFGLIALSPLFAVAGGGIGIILGLLLGRDHVFAASGERVQDVWQLRDAEVARISAQLDALGPSDRNAAALEDKRARLLLAPPAVLEAYYHIGQPGPRRRPILAEHEQQHLILLERPSQAVALITDQSEANIRAEPADAVPSPS